MIGPMQWAFDAARRTGYRGYFWFPSLDPKAQMIQWTREQIAKKINWLYNNVGAVQQAIDGPAIDEVDTGLWPKPATKSRAFNSAVKAAFHIQCGHRKNFSADGEDNFFSAQFKMRRETPFRGDCFGQHLARGVAGPFPAHHFIPSWQCTDGFLNPRDPNFRDGRQNNLYGRALRWRFARSSQLDAWMTLEGDQVTHYHDPFLIGQARGISALAPVARQCFSIGDIDNTETEGVLLRARMAYAIERQKGDDDGPTLLPGAELVEKKVQDDGSVLYVQRITAPGGHEVDVADLTQGKSIKVLESNKASESGSWIERLLMSVAHARKYPPQYLFWIAGMAQGTLVRAVQQKVQRVVNTVRDFQIIMQFIDDWYPFWLWDNIKAGTFDNVRGGIPDEWWPYIVVRPKDMTVDMGREGRLYDDRVATGKMPSGLYIGMLYGEDEEDVEDQIIHDAYRRRQRNREIAEELAEEEIEIEKIFRPPPGTAAATEAQDPVQDDEENDEEEDETKPKNKG
jgi:hypothetical protein